MKKYKLKKKLAWIPEGTEFFRGEDSKMYWILSFGGHAEISKTIKEFLEMMLAGDKINRDDWFQIEDTDLPIELLSKMPTYGSIEGAVIALIDRINQIIEYLNNRN